MYGGFEILQPDISDQESRLQVMEMQSLFANISREIRSITGSEFSESTNSYVVMKNEDFTKTVERLKQLIKEGAVQGRDTIELRNNLMLVGQIINSRR